MFKFYGNERENCMISWQKGRDVENKFIKTTNNHVLGLS